MKKIRIIVALAFVVMLCCVLAVSASAKWWDDNPFTDVKSTSWYYDAVRICNENGLFEGMTETTFATSTGMTRSMFVTVLAAADESYDASQYTKSSFSDIREGSWYLAPAEWANSIGVANGIGEGAFGPKNTITRQELALMLCKYAQYKGMDVATNGSVDMSTYPDNSTASSWATTALEWSVQNGLISGVASGNETLLSPKGTATRAMVAQIMVKYLALDPVHEINGNDISLYKIVYSANEIESVEDAANNLSYYIEKSLGIKLPVVTDDAEVSEYEILVGRTNREDQGLVTVNRDAFEGDQNILASVQGNYMVITGIDSSAHNDDGSRTTYNVEGSYNAVHYFSEEKLGVEFYSKSSGRGMDEDGIIKCNPDPVISFDDGFVYKDDGPHFKTRTFYMSGSILGSGDYQSTLSTNMSSWVYDDYGNTDYQYDTTPCMSSEENIAAVISTIKKQLDKKPYASRVALGINDSNSYCQCDTCTEMYREYKTRGATIVNLCNRVSDALAEDYPNVNIELGAYTYTKIPPQGIELRDNISVEIITIQNCSGHTYFDKNCQMNKSLGGQVETWGELANELYLWDHCGAFYYMMTPVPDWDSMLANVRFFAEHGAREVLMNSILNSHYTYSDFGAFRAYLYSLIYRDPYMSEEEFNYHVNKGLEAYYGEGWKNIRSYIDTIAELGNSKCHVHHGNTSGFYDYAEVNEKVDYIDSLWEDALSKAEGNELVRLELAYTSWLYLRQCATHEFRYLNGTEEQREEYRNYNQYLYDYVTEHEVAWTETILTGDMNALDNFSASNSPENW